MKRLIIVLGLVLLFVGGSDARKKDLAGQVDNSVYTDDDYGFALAIPAAWDYSIKKAKSPVRLVLVKKQYDIPLHFQHAPNYTTIPKITVYVDTSSLTPDQFADSMLSEGFKSKQKNNIFQEFKNMFGNFQLKKRSRMNAGEIPGVRISTQLRYTLEVQRAGSESDRADVVSDFYGGSIFFAKKDKYIIMLNLVCEWRYFDSIEKEFLELLNGLRFTEG